MPFNYVATWFYAESKDDESFYPQVGGKTSSPEFQKVYWRCVYVFYKTAILTQNSPCRYLFFTNVPNIPTDVDGVDISGFFARNGIEVVRLELTKKTPADWYGAWRNQLYIFDILNHLHSLNGNFVVLDSDIIFRKDLTGLFQDIRENDIVEYLMGGELDNPINGTSIRQMRDLYTDFCSQKAENLKYGGGEMVACSSSGIEQLLREFPSLWEKNYQQYLNHKPKLNEEAHFLSLLYYRVGHQNDFGNKYINRMWTTPSYDTLSKDDINLAMWHLPAEKKYAFNKLFKYLQSEHSTEEYLRYSERLIRIKWPKALRRALRVSSRLYQRYRK